MNIRCSFCQTPYTLGRVALLDALQEVDAKKLTHYDAHCPRCRRAIPIQRQRLEMAMPRWRDELKAFEKEMKAHPQQEAPLPTPVTTPVAAAAPASAAEEAAAKRPAKTSAAPREKTAAKKPTASRGGTKKSK